MIYIVTIANVNNVLAQQTPNFPLYNQIMASLLPLKNSSTLINQYSESRFSQPLFSTSELHYPLQPLQCERQKAPYNILMIAIDTWRYDAFNPQLTPHITEFSKTAWLFNHHISGGNSTQAGLFSLFYGLSNNYWSAMMRYHQGALLIDEAIKQQFDTRVFFSSAMKPPFDQTIFVNVKPLRITQAAGETISDHDRAITHEFKKFLESRNVSQPFFTFLFYDSAHSYYLKQNIPAVFPVKNIETERLFIQTKSNILEIKNRYKNAVHFVDQEINNVLEMLKDKKILDNTIIIVTSDHGEEFNDNGLGYWGHGSNYTLQQIQVPLIIKWPHQPSQTITHRTSHYDIAPFLMSRVLGCRNQMSDYSIGEDLLATHVNPFILVGSYVNMCIVEPQKYSTLLTSGDIVTADNHARLLTNDYLNQNLLKDALWLMRKYHQH